MGSRPERQDMSQKSFLVEPKEAPGKQNSQYGVKGHKAIKEAPGSEACSGFSN